MHREAVSIAREIVLRLETVSNKQEAFESVCELSRNFCELVPREFKKKCVPFLVTQIDGRDYVDYLDEETDTQEFVDKISKGFPTEYYHSMVYMAYSDPFDVERSCIAIRLWGHARSGKYDALKMELESLDGHAQTAINYANFWIRFLESQSRDEPSGKLAHEPKMRRSKQLKIEKAIAFVKLKQPVKGILIANHIDVAESTFLTHYVPILRKYGMDTKGNGYFFKASDSS